MLNGIMLNVIMLSIKVRLHEQRFLHRWYGLELAHQVVLTRIDTIYCSFAQGAKVSMILPHFTVISAKFLKPSAWLFSLHTVKNCSELLRFPGTNTLAYFHPVSVTKNNVLSYQTLLQLL